MSLRYYIEHIQGGRWLMPSGFVKEQARALTFDTEADARAYMKSAGFKPKQHNIVRMQTEEEAMRQGMAQTEYDPFKVRK